MSNLYSRIKKRFEMTQQNWKRDCGFSKQLACFRLIDDIGGRVGLRDLAEWAHLKKDAWILKYLQNKLQTAIDKYQNDTFMGKENINAPIWVCWWSGEKNAPALVRQCIKSIRENAGQHPVCLISENNYKKYLELSEHILRKLNSGSMCIANFTDYLRVSLLEKYGGLWLDATIFCTNKIPTDYFNAPIFTCKSNLVKTRYISNMRWTSFCLGGWKGSLFYRFCKEAFETYWQDEMEAIDYLLIDYIIELAHQNLPKVKQYIDIIPNNNIHRDDLQAAMNKCLPAESFWKVIQKDTIFYKLSWRETYLSETLEGNESIYAYFLKMDI